MLKRFLILFTTVLLVQTGVTQAAEEKRPEVGRYVKAYSGAENLKVWTTRIGPESNHEALLQIGGIDHAWDMKIMKVKIEPAGKSDRYIAQVDGKPFTALILTNESAELYLPNAKRVYSVGYSKELSEQGNSERFLTDYLQQGEK